MSNTQTLTLFMFKFWHILFIFRSRQSSKSNDINNFVVHQVITKTFKLGMWVRVAGLSLGGNLM